MRTAAPILMSLMLVLTVVGAPFLHNAIPHGHTNGDGVYTDNHSAGPGPNVDDETSVWASLHSAFKHEDSSFLAVVVVMMLSALELLVRMQPIMIGTLAALVVLSVLGRSLLFRIDKTESLLSRGIDLSRRFG